jgi:hypothetical protein
VSHRIRKEKICLNCGTETPGHYCPTCGQKNIEPKQSIWHILGHTFSDITHWDGKFFSTVKLLFAKPGFLSTEYMIGRRMRYLDPIRMYIFTSAIFFLIIFSMFNVNNLTIGHNGKSKLLKTATLSEMLAKAKNKEDSAEIMKLYKSNVEPYVKFGRDSIEQQKNANITVEPGDYATSEAYDSAQKVLPENQREGWLKRKISLKKIELTQRYNIEGSGLIREMVNNNEHNLPKVLFISLPVFALILKLLYIRRKQFYYVDHGIFSVHLYIFSIIIILVFFGILKLQDNTGWRWLSWLIFVIVLYPFFYYYKAMRKFYGQSRAKTIIKYILLFFLSFIGYLVVFLAGIIFTVFEM